MPTSSSFAAVGTQARSHAASGTVLQRLGMRWRRARAQQRDIDRITLELQGYSDRQLADLGMSRADIPDVARGTFRVG